MGVILSLHIDLFAGLKGKLFLGLMGLLFLASLVPERCSTPPSCGGVSSAPSGAAAAGGHAGSMCTISWASPRCSGPAWWVSRA